MDLIFYIPPHLTLRTSRPLRNGRLKSALRAKDTPSPMGDGSRRTNVSELRMRVRVDSFHTHILLQSKIPLSFWSIRFLKHTSIVCVQNLNNVLRCLTLLVRSWARFAPQDDSSFIVVLTRYLVGQVCPTDVPYSSIAFFGDITAEFVRVFIFFNYTFAYWL